MDEPPRQKRRIIVADDEEEEEDVGDIDNRSTGSNPDIEIDETVNDLEDDEGEDLAENWIDDYAPAPELDYYDPAVLAADDDVEQVSYEERMRSRRAADEELDKLDAIRRERDDDIDDALEGANEREQEDLDDYSEDEQDLPPVADRALNLEAFECPLREWIAEERTRREIKRRFRSFLLTYYPNMEDVARWRAKHDRDDGNPMPPLPANLKVLPPVYLPKIRTMCAANKCSLEVSYVHLGEVHALLAIWLTDLPKEMLQIFDEVLYVEVIVLFPHYAQIASETHVRITSLPLSDKLRDLRQADLNSLVRVSGVVTRRTGVFPQLKSVAYDCKNCGQTVGPFQVSGGIETRPSTCVNCQTPNSFVTNAAKTEYGNFQKMTLQETPGSVPAGRVPRYKDVILLGDLIDIARPGEEVEVTGVYMHAQKGDKRDKSGFPVFATVIEANCIQKRNGATNNDLSDEDKRKIKELSNDPQIVDRIIRSIAPSIYGHRHVKTAIALALFGGCAKEAGVGGTHRVRGDINVLLLGDPGTAKSQILKYAEKAAPRSVYTTGKGASAVGLTAGVHMDPMTREWTLEGGALVLADQGVCLIDEFDKMNEQVHTILQDRTSIHEAMEQQTISVSKAGIVTSLQARCAVLAAANPIGGRYDPTFSLAENVELTDPILQRFDILCVLQDLVDPVVDEQLALFVVNSHIRSHPDLNNGVIEEERETVKDGLARDLGEEEDDDEEDNIQKNNAKFQENIDGPKAIDQALFRKYLIYSKAFVRPVLQAVDSEKISSLYAELRRQSSISGGVPIAVRHIESMMRMSEASARMHLRDSVREDDVDLAIKVMLESFLQAQKVSVRKTLQRSFRRYVTYGEENNQLIMHQLQNLITEVEKYKVIRKATNDRTEVHTIALENRAKDLNIHDLRSFYKSPLFRSHGLKLDEVNQLIIKQY